MKEVDWDNPDEVVVDFEDIEEVAMLPDGDSDDDEEDVPTKKESIVKPKISGFNINFRDLEAVVSALTAAEMQLQNNITELKKLDNISSRAAALVEIDTDKIIKKLDSVSFSKVEEKILKSINDRFNNFEKELNMSSAAASEAARELVQKTELLKESSDSMLEINNMSDSLFEVEKKIKNWKTRTIYGSVGLSLFFGLLTGVILSNFNSFFASKNEAIQNAELLTPKFGKIAVIPHKSDPKTFYMAFGAKELSPQIETLEQNGVRYIVFHAQK